MPRTIFIKLLRNNYSGPFIQRIGGAMLRNGPGMITCAQFEEFLINYTEDHLTAAQLELFERHMKVCPMCRTTFTSYLKVIELGQAICKEDERNQSFSDAPQELIDAIIDTSYRDRFK